MLFVHLKSDFLYILHRFTQKKIMEKKHKVLVLILKDKNYTKVNPTGFLLQCVLVYITDFITFSC